MPEQSSDTSQMRKKDKWYDTTGEPDKRKVEYGDIRLGEGEFLEWKRRRQYGIDHDIEQKTKTNQVPEEDHRLVQFFPFPDIAEIKNERRGKTRKNVKIPALEGHEPGDDLVPAQPKQYQFHRDTDNMQQGQRTGVKTVDKTPPHHRREQQKDHQQGREHEKDEPGRDTRRVCVITRQRYETLENKPYEDQDQRQDRMMRGLVKDPDRQTGGQCEYYTYVSGDIVHEKIRGKLNENR